MNLETVLKHYGINFSSGVDKSEGPYARATITGVFPKGSPSGVKGTFDINPSTGGIFFPNTVGVRTIAGELWGRVGQLTAHQHRLLKIRFRRAGINL